MATDLTGRIGVPTLLLSLEETDAVPEDGSINAISISGSVATEATRKGDFAKRALTASQELRHCRADALTAQKLARELSKAIPNKIRLTPLVGILTEDKPIRATILVRVSYVMPRDKDKDKDADGQEKEGGDSKEKEKEKAAAAEEFDEVVTRAELNRRLKWLQVAKDDDRSEVIKRFEGNAWDAAGKMMDKDGEEKSSLLGSPRSSVTSLEPRSGRSSLTGAAPKTAAEARASLQDMDKLKEELDIMNRRMSNQVVKMQQDLHEVKQANEEDIVRDEHQSELQQQDQQKGDDNQQQMQEQQRNKSVRIREKEASSSDEEIKRKERERKEKKKRDKKDKKSKYEDSTPAGSDDEGPSSRSDRPHMKALHKDMEIQLKKEVTRLREELADAERNSRAEAAAWDGSLNINAQEFVAQTMKRGEEIEREMDEQRKELLRERRKAARLLTLHETQTDEVIQFQKVTNHLTTTWSEMQDMCTKLSLEEAQAVAQCEEATTKYRKQTNELVTAQQAAKDNGEMREKLLFLQDEVCLYMHRLVLSESGESQSRRRVLTPKLRTTLGSGHHAGMGSPASRMNPSALVSQAVASSTDEEARGKAERLLRILNNSYDTVLGTIDSMAAGIEKRRVETSS